jgi:hypothetical protein
MNMLSYEFANTAANHRRLEATADTDEERLHWQLEAQRFEELARIAETNPREARRRYRPSESYRAPVAEYADTETAYGQTTRHPYTFRVF